MEYNTSMCLLMHSFINVIDIVMLSVAGAAVAALIVVIVLFAVSNHRAEKHNKEINELSNSLRIFVIDIPNDTVRFFNSAHLRERRTTSITTFYNQYFAKERESLINWIGNLLAGDEETPKFLEVTVYIKTAKQNVLSILEVQKIDYEKQVIFLESHLLQTTFKSKHKGERIEFAKQDYLFKRILMSNGRGATFAFNFFNKMTKTSDFSQLAYADIRDIMVSFSSEDILVTEEKFGQIIITNFNLKGRLEINAFIDQVKSRVNRFLLIRSYSDDIDYTIGVIENSENFRDAHTLLKNVLMVSDLAKDSMDAVELAFTDTLSRVGRDTIWIHKRNIHHWDDPSCPVHMWHQVLDVRSTHHLIDTVLVPNPTINYDGLENFQIYFYVAD